MVVWNLENKLREKHLEVDHFKKQFSLVHNAYLKIQHEYKKTAQDLKTEKKRNSDLTLKIRALHDAFSVVQEELAASPDAGRLPQIVRSVLKRQQAVFQSEQERERKKIQEERPARDIENVKSAPVSPRGDIRDDMEAQYFPEDEGKKGRASEFSSARKTPSHSAQHEISGVATERTGLWSPSKGDRARSRGRHQGDDEERQMASGLFRTSFSHESIVSSASSDVLSSSLRLSQMEVRGLKRQLEQSQELVSKLKVRGSVVV